jgi:hypothetical protein
VPSSLRGGAQTAATALLAGKVVSETGRALRATVVLQPLFPGAARTTPTTLAGTYQFSQVQPGKYRICAQATSDQTAPSQPFLDACEWSMAEGPVELYPGQTVTTFQVTVGQGALLQIQIDDPQQILGALPNGLLPAGLDGQLQVILRTPNRQVHRARLLSAVAGGRVYYSIVPTGTAIGLTIVSPSAGVYDNSGTPVTAEIPFNFAGGSTPAPVGFTIRN